MTGPTPKHVVVGTAGHIDHGKTSLVKALTGIDTDRLPEEKARGITIDLGFAFLEEVGGLTIEIVDVPGHERFVKNMLAGVGGIDLAMLVIAADEGVMPQTREHLAICSLLHIRAGLIALTKADLVEPDWLGLVDRVFTVKGFGTVVTGTLTTGALAVDDRVEVYPRSTEAKIRGLQAHGHAVASAQAGQRTAVNLQGLERAAIARGDVVGLPGTLVPTLLIDGTLELLKDAPRAIRSRTRVRFHVGTSEIMARALLLDRPELAPGETAFARFRLEAPLVARPGDRFVVRSYSPIVTIGGGTLLDVDPPRFKRKAPALVAHLTLLQTGSPEAVLEEHVRHVGAAGVRLATLAGRVPFGPERLRGLLDALRPTGRVVAVDRDWFIHPDSFTRLRMLVVDALAAFHRANPLKPGMSREELRGRAGGADERVFAFLLSSLVTGGTVKTERDKVRLASHEVRLSPEQQRVVDRLEDDFLRAEAAPPSAEEALGRAGLGGDEEHELFQVLVQAGKLVRVKESLFFHTRALDAIQTKLVALLRERKEIGPADIKDLLGISRKYAIPLLEFFDQRRVTARVGERRILRAG
ncbi:MAG: selenocysteine-specific translation factor [Candidatus Rokuibacteriota bacterium]|nr:MAG: selenocysteine-specific translation factor [Candidatus Rokubacteria bacterium]